MSETHFPFLVHTPLTNRDPEEAFRVDVLEKYSSIKANYDWSLSVRKKIENKLKTLKELNTPKLNSIVICGSYARLDASQWSDVDRMILPAEAETDMRAIRRQVDKVLDDLGLPKSNPKGVFATDVDTNTLLERLGSRDETYDDLSRRLLLLLESRAVFRPENHTSLVNRIVDRYGEDIKLDPKKNYVFLLNDLIRYFRTICVNYVHTKDSEWGKWPIRNLKLRHSRVLMYFSLVACIGQLSVYREPDKNDVLRKYIKLTPLERLYRIYCETNDTGFFRLAGYYDVFLSFLNSKKDRDRLTNLEYESRYSERSFAVLKANSDAMSAELLRFLLDRRGQWSDRFFEYIII